jgi:phosphoesterase RecJ-like protein
MMTVQEPTIVSGNVSSASGVDWPRFVELIRSKQRIVLTTHVRPDGDAIGSELAMAEALQQLGKQVDIVNGFDLPPSFQFLDPHAQLKRLESVPGEVLDSAELLLIVDTSAWAQLGDMAAVIRTTNAAKAALDHHVTSDDLGAELFKDTQAEATGRLVIEAADHLGVKLTPQIAVPAFAALTTDTGWFRFASTTAQTHRLAARLIDAGAVPHQLYKCLYENDSRSRLELIGRAIMRVQTELAGRLIYTHIGRDDFDAAGAMPSDSEDVINLLLSVGGTEVAVILVEQIGGGYKISFRSRSAVDCSRLAEQFGGGGHKAAAGAFLREPLEVAQARILDAVRKAMR